MKIDNRDIFEQIGNLFYSVAAGQNVKPLEAGELKSLISKDWLPRNHSNEPLVANETHYILVAMDALEASKANAKDAFEEFARFYKMYHYVFTLEVEQRIVETAEEIAKVFKADNPLGNAELIALKELFGLANAEKVAG